MNRQRRFRCHTHLHGHSPRSSAEILRTLADYAEAHGSGPDEYGVGPTIEALEQKIAKLLGKPAAVFMPSGTMAQQIALRVWADRARNPCVGLHPTSHLDRDEHRGYSHLHGLQGVILGHPDLLLSAEDVKRCPTRMSTVVLELPMRRIGGQLPTWNDFVTLAKTVRARKTRLHLDGARLWEVGPAWNRSYAAISRYFDSVYVSLYKGVGAMAGAVLAGSESFIGEAKIWRRRQGGNLPTSHPFVLGALKNLDAKLVKMYAYRERAWVVSDRIRRLPRVQLVPDPPQVNMVHVHFQAKPAEVLAARDEVADDTGVWLFSGAQPTATGSVTEIYFGDGALLADLDQVDEAWQRLIAVI